MIPLSGMEEWRRYFKNFLDGMSKRWEIISNTKRRMTVTQHFLNVICLQNTYHTSCEWLLKRILRAFHSPGYIQISKWGYIQSKQMFRDPQGSFLFLIYSDSFNVLIVCLYGVTCHGIFWWRMGKKITTATTLTIKHIHSIANLLK